MLIESPQSLAGRVQVIGAGLAHQFDGADADQQVLVHLPGSWLAAGQVYLAVAVCR